MVEIKLFELYTKIKVKFLNSGVENYKMESSWILSNFFECSSSEIFLNKSKLISLNEYNSFLDKVDSRCKGYPLQYILGETLFYNRTFFVGEGVLIPRADTEVLCEISLNLIRENNFKSALDLCSGTGCIGITLEREAQLKEVFCIEKSELAIAYFNKNKIYHESKVELFKMDVLNSENVNRFDKFDIIVSNPPYLNDVDLSNLQKEVNFEPRMALYASDNGFKFYNIIVEFWSKLLKNGGVLALEVGIGQASSVVELLFLNSFKNIAVEKDINGINRVIYGYKIESKESV